MRTDLMASLTGQFDREIDRGVQRVQESIAPYTRFVRSERERLTEIREELSAVGRQLASLQDRIRA